MKRRAADTRQGFSLLEMSIVLVIIAGVATTGVVTFTASMQNRQWQETESKQRAIQEALYHYRLTKNRIPCPTDVTLALNEANFGVEAATQGTCSGGNPAANFSNGNNVQGGVPVKTLRLPDEYAFDGWGRRFMYTVDKRFTANVGFISQDMNVIGSIFDEHHPEIIPYSNVALASVGATVAASSVYSTAYPAESTINGSRLGVNWGNGDGWNDGTGDTMPDWLEVRFNGDKNIDEINVITLGDNFPGAVDPTLGMIFTLYGIVDFEVQYWDGNGWVTVPGGNVTGNNYVWRQFNFAPIRTSKIRVHITQALASFSRIVELEAWAEDKGEEIYALTSFGLNGHGAYPRQGGTTRINTESINTDELNNCDCDNGATATGLDGAFVQKQPMIDATTPDGTNNFDDIVVYGTRASLRKFME